MQEPSIKGVLVQGVVEILREHRERGTIGPDELEARLEKADLELLEDKIIQAVGVSERVLPGCPSRRPDPLERREAAAGSRHLPDGP